MKSKNSYRAPELEIIHITAIDIVTASIGSDNGFDGETDTDW